MAYGLPVVTTPIGAEGITSDNSNVLMIAANENEFAQQIADVYQDENLWLKLSNNSRRHIQQYFSPENVKNTLNQIIAKCINSKNY